MKVARPNTDQEAEFQLYINDKAATELVLPFTASTAPSNIAQCFVAVNPGDKLTVKGSFSGTVWAGTFDLVADGSFLHESRIESSAGAAAKILKNRKVGFEKVLNCPYPPEWKSISAPTPMYEGTLHVKKLEDEFADQYLEWETPIPDAEKPGIGSLCVTVNIGEDSISKHHKPDHWIDISGVSDERELTGGWRRQPQQSERELRPYKPQVVLESRVQPDCQLFFQENPEDSDAGQKRSSKHRKHWKDTRPGHKAWCKFVFYYRTKAVLQATGCVERTEEVQQLDPAINFKQGTDPKAKKKARDEDEDDMTRPTKKRQTGKHLGGMLELPKSKGPLGGTLHIPGKSPSKSPSVDDFGRSKSAISDSAFLQELADYEAGYDRSQAEEEDEKQRQRRGIGNSGDMDSGTDSTHDHDEAPLKRPSIGRAKRPDGINESYPSDRLGEPVMHTTGIDEDDDGMSRLTRRGSIALGDHKLSRGLQPLGVPRSAAEVSYEVRSAKSSKALLSRTRTRSFSNKHNSTTSTYNTIHRRSDNMPAYDNLPLESQIRNFIGNDGCRTGDLIQFFNDYGPYQNQKKVQQEFMDRVNRIADTDLKADRVTLRKVKSVRTRGDTDRAATNGPTPDTPPTTRKRASANAELFSLSDYHADTQDNLTEPFNQPEPVAKDEAHFETHHPAANTPSMKQTSNTDQATDYNNPTTSDRSRKRGMFEMAGQADTDAPPPPKKHTLISDDALEQARQRLEANKQRIDNERREIQLKRAQKEAEMQQKKLAFEAEMARRAEKKRIKDEKKRLKEEEKARKAEEKRREEEEKIRLEEVRAAEEARLKQEAEQAKQRELDMLAYKQEEQEMILAEEALEAERAELEEAEQYEIPPEEESESEDEDEAAEESEEELMDLTMMHQACSADEDAFAQSQRGGFEFEMSSSETIREESL